LAKTQAVLLPWDPIASSRLAGDRRRFRGGCSAACAPRWQVLRGQQQMQGRLFTEFLDLLIHDIDGKIFLIVDNVTYHVSKETGEWVWKT
jgi:hypothetical protein